MVGRPFCEYHDTYMNVVPPRLHGDSLSRAELVNFFREAAGADALGEWDILAQMMENTVRFYKSRKGGYAWSASYTSKEYSDDMAALATRAGEKRFPYLKIYALYQAAEGYRTFAEDYQRAFACYLEATAALDTITTAEFPPRPHIYNHIAALYYDFREYDEAIIYYRKIVEDPDVSGNYYNSYFSAMNGLGLSYRNGFKDYRRSDSCFMEILTQTAGYEPDRIVWQGIAEGNIGYNYYLRNETDTALQWFIPAIPKITRIHDFAFASLRAVNVADIYMDKGNTTAAGKYLDIALDYHNRAGNQNKDSRLYRILSRYHTYTGHRETATAYLDSAMTAKDKESEAFSGLVLRRVEQQLRTADAKIHEQVLDAERLRSKVYMRTTLLVSVALIIIFALLAFTLFFYRRKRNAYRELVRQNQRWAANRSEAEPEESDKIIIESIEKIVTAKMLYKYPDLTLDTLAAETGYNRYYISTALNRCTGKNFNTYINEYRVKEAIRIMSTPERSKLTIENIAFEAGFNDRKNFYKVFKKNTGLSPTEFRKNR